MSVLTPADRILPLNSIIYHLRLLINITQDTHMQSTCAYEKCSCHDRSNAQVASPTKTCSACGIVSYCSKQTQLKDWPRHKKLCSGFRPFKEMAGELSTCHKLALNNITFELPSIEHEYRKRYSGGYNKLHYLYIQRGLQATQDMVTSNLCMLNREDNDKGNMLKRWQELSPAVCDFCCEADEGEVFKEKSYMPYNPGAPQQFRNTPLAEPTVLVNGKTIVDIGFVDFGIAFDSAGSIQFDEEPVTVLGFDTDPFCVAKSLVMHTMIQAKQVSARSIVEVWLSSLWSKATLSAFKRATRSILDHDVDADLNDEVKVIIEYWNRQEKMSSKAALKFQMEGLLSDPDSKFAMNCCSLAQEFDRVAYLRYYLTKALYEDDSMTVGSIVMNTVNEDIGIKQAFESCFEAAPARIHLLGAKTGSSVIGRTITFFESNMETYMRHIQNGTIVFTPKLGTLSENNSVLMQEIKDAKPFIISWSNIVDYIHPQKFHTIAKKVSCEDTAHYFHSCNWTTRVFATDVYDLILDCRLYFYSAGLFAIESSHSLLEGFTKQGTNHFRTTCATVLGRKFVHKFFQYFFEGQRVNCSCFNGNTPLKMSFPFARGPTAAYIVFAYEETGISFGEDTYDFNTDETGY